DQQRDRPGTKPRNSGNSLDNPSIRGSLPPLRRLPCPVFVLTKPNPATLPSPKPDNRQGPRQDPGSISQTLHPNRKEAKLRRRAVPIPRRHQQSQKSPRLTHAIQYSPRPTYPQNHHSVRRRSPVP